MISEITVAMQGGMGLGRLAGVIHPYPTAAEAIRQCGDAYNRERPLHRTVKSIFHNLMGPCDGNVAKYTECRQGIYYENDSRTPTTARSSGP